MAGCNQHNHQAKAGVGTDDNKKGGRVRLIERFSAMKLYLGKSGEQSLCSLCVSMHFIPEL